MWTVRDLPELTPCPDLDSDLMGVLLTHVGDVPLSFVQVDSAGTSGLRPQQAMNLGHVQVLAFGPGLVVDALAVRPLRGGGRHLQRLRVRQTRLVEVALADVDARAPVLCGGVPVSWAATVHREDVGTRGLTADKVGATTPTWWTKRWVAGSPADLVALLTGPVRRARPRGLCDGPGAAP